MNEQDLRYPIGEFTYRGPTAAALRNGAIARLASLPDRLEQAVSGLTADQWQVPYRPGGWTVQEVVHHLPDSHVNAYVRFKTALVEDRPVIRPYDEARWATLGDRDTAPEVSLRLLRALHERWIVLLRGLGDSEFRRTLYHPEHERWITLDELVMNYAWHGDHHLAHITSLAVREGWERSPLGPGVASGA